MHSRCYRSEGFYDESKYKMRSGAAAVHQRAANTPVGVRGWVDVQHSYHTRAHMHYVLAPSYLTNVLSQWNYFVWFLTQKYSITNSWHLYASADRTTARPWGTGVSKWLSACVNAPCPRSLLHPPPPLPPLQMLFLCISGFQRRHQFQCAAATVNINVEHAWCSKLCTDVCDSDIQL